MFCVEIKAVADGDLISMRNGVLMVTKKWAFRFGDEVIASGDQFIASCVIAWCTVMISCEIIAGVEGSQVQSFSRQVMIWMQSLSDVKLPKSRNLDLAKKEEDDRSILGFQEWKKISNVGKTPLDNEVRYTMEIGVMPLPQFCHGSCFYDYSWNMIVQIKSSVYHQQWVVWTIGRYVESGLDCQIEIVESSVGKTQFVHFHCSQCCNTGSCTSC